VQSRSSQGARGRWSGQRWGSAGHARRHRASSRAAVEHRQQGRGRGSASRTEGDGGAPAARKETGERRAEEAGEVVREAEASEMVRQAVVGEVVREEEADHRRPLVVGLRHPRGDEEAREAEADHRGSTNGVAPWECRMGERRGDGRPGNSDSGSVGRSRRKGVRNKFW
jgi:hypothetical protein